jgi:enhancing lycopene biosynthesis protein 2
MIALAATGVGLFADAGIAAAIVGGVGTAAGLTGTVMDGQECHNSVKLGCIGGACDAVATAGSGSAMLFPAEATNITMMSLPFAVTGFDIDTDSALSEMRSH